MVDRRLAALPDPQQPTSPERAATARPGAAIVYWVQIGLFENQKTAIRLLTDLLEKKLPVEIGPTALRTTRGDLQVTRLRVGPYADRRSAAAALAELRRAGYAPMIATEPATSAPAAR